MASLRRKPHMHAPMSTERTTPDHLDLTPEAGADAFRQLAPSAPFGSYQNAQQDETDLLAGAYRALGGY